MSVTIKQNTIGFRDENGDFHYANTIGEKPTSEYINQIKEQGKSTLATIPTDYTSLYNEVQSLKSRISALEASLTSTTSSDDVNVEVDNSEDDVINDIESTSSDDTTNEI